MRRVASEVPEKSIVRPILFLIYMADLDSGVSSYLGKLSDYTETGWAIRIIIRNK